MSDLSLLLEMGFSKEKAVAALEQTGHRGIQEATEWLLIHGNEESDSNDFINVDDIEEGATSSNPSNTNEKILEDFKNMLCEECNLTCATEFEMNNHAVETGHARFTEIGESKQKTEEEKKEQLKRVESLIKQRRAEKEQEQKRDEIEREKNRRKAGQEFASVRQRLSEQEMLQLADAKKREKLEARLTKQKILEDIERDKRDRRERFVYKGTDIPAISSDTKQVETKPPVEPPKEYDSCRLQIRLTNGETLIHTFLAKEELAAVQLYINMNRTDGKGPFMLMTAFPKRIFSEEDMSIPLHRLGLVPSAVLIIKPC